MCAQPRQNNRIQSNAFVSLGIISNWAPIMGPKMKACGVRRNTYPIHCQYDHRARRATRPCGTVTKGIGPRVLLDDIEGDSK